MTVVCSCVCMCVCVCVCVKEREREREREQDNCQKLWTRIRLTFAIDRGNFPIIVRSQIGRNPESSGEFGLMTGYLKMFLTD